MKTKLISGFVLFFLLVGASGFSQQDPMVSQYMFNGLFLNPAYAGTHDYFTSSHSYRKQWVGFDGSPQTIISAVDGPIKGKNMGVGAIFFNDQIGVSTQNSFLLNYSYQLKVSEKGKLSMGLSGGLSQFSARLSELTVWDGDDPVFSNDLTSRLIPRFGFGLYYFQDNFYAGFSIPTLLAYQQNRDFSFNVNNATFLHRHYLLTFGYIFEVTDEIKLKPSVLLKYLPHAPVQADVNLGVLFKDTFWIGTSFRTGDASVVLVEYQSNSYFRVGYAYDITFSALRHHSAGSHEVVVGIDFGRDLTTVKTPRFF